MKFKSIEMVLYGHLVFVLVLSVVVSFVPCSHDMLSKHCADGAYMCYM